MTQHTNADLISEAIRDLNQEKRNLSVSEDYMGGFLAGLDYMDDDYDEGDNGIASEYIESTWAKFRTITDGEVSFPAKFKQLNLTDGSPKLVFEPDASSDKMGQIMPMNGNRVMITMSDTQQRMNFVTDHLREKEAPEKPCEGQEPIIYELPAGDVDVEDAES